MRLPRLTALAILLSLSAACAPIAPASRGSAQPVALDEIVVPGAEPAVALPHYRIEAVRVEVPRSLEVSEANVYYPLADIVWRGDPMGDRYAQVTALFTEAGGRLSSRLDTGRPVLIDIVVERFHAVTEKTRYTVGGTYGVRFMLTVRDAETGLAIDGPREISSSHPAAGGLQALGEEARGLTQKVVVTQFLANLLMTEISRPVPARTELGESLSTARPSR